MTDHNPYRQMNDVRWQAIQDRAKAEALEAISIGCPKGLTKLSLAYYYAYLHK